LVQVRDLRQCLIALRKDLAAAQHLAKFRVLSGAETLELAITRLKAQLGPKSRTTKGIDFAVRGRVMTTFR
jgi:hypothetical protein